MRNTLQKTAVVALLSSFSFLSQAQDLNKNVEQKIYDDKGEPSLIIFNTKANVSSSNYQSLLKENLNLKNGFTFQKIKYFVT